MKQFGYAILALGVMAILCTLSIDTSVPSGMFGRVNNIGLMQEKQNYLIVSSLIVLVGVVLAVAGFNVPPPRKGYGIVKNFFLIILWFLVFLAGGYFLNTLTPQYREDKIKMEKDNLELQQATEELQRSLGQLEEANNRASNFTHNRE